MEPRGFSWLSRHGAATALVDEAGAEISYAQLAGRCEAFAESCGEGRQLILLQAANDVESVVAYLAGLGAGHVTILTGDSEAAFDDRILRAFSPTIVCRRGEIRRLGDASPALLHPDLAVLLPTSGSTGRPKLVRLSRKNLETNADAIVEYLSITAQDRAISSLPFHYSYGMSVLNSHLRAGASVVLTDMSVTHPEFWRLFRTTRVTSIAGVPYSYELFERIGLRDDPPETLKVMTQAGGRLSPELVKTYAAFGEATGVRFFAMYGQTEAAPRMAYLPPGLAAQNPDCIGVAIPGGCLDLVAENGAEVTQPNVTGELVYRGPNVMMGYAGDREALARGAEVEALRTGDLAMRTKDGLIRIVGRASRFVKIVGLRIDLDDLEAVLARTGRRAYVAGTDDGVTICVVGDDNTATTRAFVAQRCGLPMARVAAFSVANAPRLPSGKVDYETVLALGGADAAGATLTLGTDSIAGVYAEALAIDPPPANATFASLGGDSLSYVSASIGVERVLGQLPHNWETMSIAGLDAMATMRKPAATSWGWINSEFVVRVTALSLIMAGHAVPGYGWWLRGGANILFALAGFNLVRFQGDHLRAGSIRPAIGASLSRVILPYLICTLLSMIMFPADSSPYSLLSLSVFTEKSVNPLRIYWFIETLLHALLITSSIFLFPSARRLSATRPFTFALALIAAATGLMYVFPFLWNDGFKTHNTIDAWLYAYYLGWGAYVAKRPWQKALVVALAALIGAVQYGFPSFRDFWLTAGLTVVVFAPRLKLPHVVNAVVLKLAAASYFIFLMQAFVFEALQSRGAGIHAPLARIALLWIGSVIAGLAFARSWTFAAARAQWVVRGLIVGLRAVRPRAA